MPPNGYCPTDGNPHEWRTSKFCPACGIRLYEDSETIDPGQKKEQAIALESDPSSDQTSPEKTHAPFPEKKPTAIYVPAVATQSSKSAAPPVDANGKAVLRTMVEASRQASIQRTSASGPGKGPQPKLQICVQLFLVEYSQLDQDGYEIPVFQEYRSIRTYLVLEAPIDRPSAHQSNIDKAMVHIPICMINSMDDFMRNYVLVQFPHRVPQLDTSLPLELASDMSPKDGPTYLPESANEYRTTKDLIESGLFKKDARASAYMYLCFRKKSDAFTFDAETLDDLDALQSNSAPKKSSSKKAAKGKTSKKAGNDQKARESKTYEPPKIKSEFRHPPFGQDDKREVVARKRNVSQLSDIQHGPEDENETIEDQDAREVVHTLRNRDVQQ